ncbi:helix-turn-helix domain-containing protein [Myroides odoratus]|uniref:DNA-binding transcriptional activator FeaR n=1 Tax=Myroides odoratus TaxID=256 RepID=A0A378U437_MYROD|nr:helix-turn-helix domain-containing protein [Myroides odoratus]QQU03311.1 helix-turn-helix domain-containing protein [Myroides odoratus]STZ69424.1 DNA-binding transcriptional activator FeaR [Myroides odoratus]
MFLKKLLSFSFITFSCYFSCALSAQTNTDYKSWSLSELLFSINSDLLNPTDKEIYLDYYLQKAKKEKASEDVIIGYRKKIFIAQNYNLQNQYADSLLHYTLQLKNIQIIGEAFNTKSHVEYVNKNYRKALEYGLKAEEYLKKSEDEYTLNKVKGSIGSIYYHLEEYDKSEKVTKEALLYYQSQLSDSSNAYNNLRGYINNVFALSKTTFRQQKNDTIHLLLRQGYEAINQLKVKDKILETAYFDLINGMYHHRLKQYSSSDSLLNKALIPIQNNRDFANEHLLYLYLGKNAWERNDKDKALSYFEKIEHLYQDKQFANVELSEAFNYLITYYQDKKDLEKELYYTKLLMTLSSELHKSNTKLSSYMHTHLDTKQLEASQKKLEYELARSKSKIKGLYGLVTVLILVVFIGLIYYQKKQQVLQSQYKQLIHQSPKETVSLSEHLQQNKIDALPLVEIPEANTLLSTNQVLIKKLIDFENKKGFLQKITQDELARQFGTNRNTLSKFFNEEKNISFSDYLKRIRIQHAVRELTYNPKLHLLNLNGLADEFGFGNSKSFSTAFKEITKLSVTDFIKMRQQDQDFKDMDNNTTIS